MESSNDIIEELCVVVPTVSLSVRVLSKDHTCVRFCSLRLHNAQHQLNPAPPIPPLPEQRSGQFSCWSIIFSTVVSRGKPWSHAGYPTTNDVAPRKMPEVWMFLLSSGFLHSRRRRMSTDAPWSCRLGSLLRSLFFYANVHIRPDHVASFDLLSYKSPKESCCRSYEVITLCFTSKNKVCIE